MPEELAERVDCHPRYLTEWLHGQAAGAYVTYDPADGRYAMTEEQIFALADPEGRSTHPGLCHGRRVHPLPARGGDPVQPGLRGPIVGPYPYPYLRHVIPQGMS
jgi:hypothetical protein